MTDTTSSTAQTAQSKGLTREDLNPKEVRVLLFLTRTEEGATAHDIAKHVFPGVRPVSKAKSWARNALRRLVREGFVRRAGGPLTASGIRVAGNGIYKATKKGMVTS